MTTHHLLVHGDHVEIEIAEGTAPSDVATAIAAFDAFTDGHPEDGTLRPGRYPFHIEPDGNPLVGRREPVEFTVGTRVRVINDPRPYVLDRTGTVGTCGSPGRYPGVPPIVVDLDPENGVGPVSVDWHFDEDDLEVLR